VFHELHGALGQLLVVEGEVDMVRPRLSTTALLLRQTVTVEPDDPVLKVFLERKERLGTHCRQ
jgi:hypothetical protein